MVMSPDIIGDDAEWMFGEARETVRYRLDMDLLMDVPRYMIYGAPAGRKGIPVCRPSPGAFSAL